MSNSRYQSLNVVNPDSSDTREEEEEEVLVGTMATSQVVSTIPSTYSSQHLMSPDTESVLTEDDRKSQRRRNSETDQSFSAVSTSQWFTVGVLCFINLINYMDRFTIAGKSKKKTHTYVIKTR